MHIPVRVTPNPAVVAQSPIQICELRFLWRDEAHVKLHREVLVGEGPSQLRWSYVSQDWKRQICIKEQSEECFLFTTQNRTLFGVGLCVCARTHLSSSAVVIIILLVDPLIAHSKSEVVSRGMHRDCLTFDANGGATWNPDRCKYLQDYQKQAFLNAQNDVLNYEGNDVGIFLNYRFSHLSRG